MTAHHSTAASANRHAASTAPDVSVHLTSVDPAESMATASTMATTPRWCGGTVTSIHRLSVRTSTRLLTSDRGSTTTPAGPTAAD